MVYVLHEGSFLAQYEAALARESEILAPRGIGLEASAIGLVGGEAVEPDDSPGDVVRALVRQVIADDGPAAAWNDLQPAPCVRREGLALEGVDLIADEAGDVHG